MKHEINLSNIDIHTDLAIDVIDKISSLDGVKQVIKNVDGVSITDVKLDKKNSLNKKEGSYITIEFDDVTDTTNYNKVKEVVKMELSSLLNKMNIKDTDTCLFIGLGNAKSTPDSLGPKVSKDIIVIENKWL